MHKVIDFKSPMHKQVFRHLANQNRSDICKTLMKGSDLGIDTSRDILEGLAYSNIGSSAVYDRLFSIIKDDILSLNQNRIEEV